MNPILYSSTETEFTNNGIGILTDAITCTVTEERNGIFELEMQYPMNGIHYESLVPRAIILANPNPVDNSQPFRIYRITRPLNGVVVVYAEHISYDLSGIPVSPFTATNVVDALQKLKQNAAITCPFDFWTDKETIATMRVNAPDSIRGLLGGQRGSILDNYSGEYKFDRFTVRLYNKRGQNRGVSIRYGKNLTELEQEENSSNVYTGVYPFWYSEETEELAQLVQLQEKIVNVDGTFDFERIEPLDLSQEWQVRPTEAQLRNRAERYIKTNDIGTAKLSLDVSFAQLEQAEEYKTLALLERVELCDTVNIYYEKLGVDATAKVIKTVYDVMLERYDSIELGDPHGSLADTIAEQGDTIQQAIQENKTNLQRAVDRATQQITGNLGGYVVLHSSTGAKEPDEILIMDEPDVETAVKVWRWNKSGLGYSSHGYNGQYGLAMTQNGEIVADFITTGTLTANLIKAGVLQSNDGETFYLDLENGILRMKATYLSISGQTVNEIAQSEADSAVLSAINNFVKAVYDPKIAELQKQIDGQIESYFFDYLPTLDNPPASNWTTDTEKAKHEGDLFYWKSKGYAYRFFKDGTQWKWQMVQDTDIAEALSKANTAQDTADNKRRVFISTPYPPYDEGDLWFESSTSDIMTCMKSRQSGNYSSNDWQKRNKYIDQTAANNAAQNAVDGQTQQFIFDKLTNGGKMQGLYMSNNDLYINASYINSGYLSANRIQGGTLYLGGSNNTYGTLIIRDSSNSEIGRWDRNGISVTAGTITSKSGNSEVGIYGGIFSVSYQSKEIGYIGTAGWTNTPSVGGIWFALHYDGGDYMTWAAQDSRNADYYTVKLLYARTSFSNYASDTLYAECQMNFFNGAGFGTDRRNPAGLIYGSTNSVDIYCTSSSYTITFGYAQNKQSFTTWMDLSNSYIGMSKKLDMRSNDIVNTSDERLKTNIEESEINALDIINSIGTYSFDWVGTGEHEQLGLIAQQLEAESNADFVDINEKDEHYSVKMLKIIPYLIKAIQELSKKIEPNTVRKIMAKSIGWKPTEYTYAEKLEYYNYLKSSETKEIPEAPEPTKICRKDA